MVELVQSLTRGAALATQKLSHLQEAKRERPLLRAVVPAALHRGR